MKKRIRDFFFPGEKIPVLAMLGFIIAYLSYVLIMEAGFIYYLHSKNQDPLRIEISNEDFSNMLQDSFRNEIFWKEEQFVEDVATAHSSLVQITDEKSQFEIALSHGYFEGEALVKKDLDQAFRIARKSIVHLYDGKYRTNGSGFIYSIEEEYLYIVTNYHVAQYMLEYCQVFFDEYAPVRGEFVGRDDFYDVAVIRVPIHEISEQRLLNLKEVAVNSNWIRVMDREPDLFMAVEYEEEEDFFDQGVFVQELAQIPSLPQYYTITTLESKPGASGSGIFDMYGYLVAMNYGRYWPEGQEQYQNICVPLIYLMEAVEKIRQQEE